MSSLAAKNRVAVTEQPWHDDVSDGMDATETNWAAIFSQWIASAPRGDGLLELTMPIAMMNATADATALASVLPHAPRVLWRDRAGQQCIGIGAVVELRASGPSRFTDIAAQAQQIQWSPLAAATPSMSRAFIGGFAFAPGAADSKQWHGFGDAWFMLPRWTYIPAVNGLTATLMLRIAGQDLSDAKDANASIVDQVQNEFTVIMDRLHTLQNAPTSLNVMQSVAPATTAMARADDDDCNVDKRKWQTLIANIHGEFAAGRADKIVAARSIEIVQQRSLDLGKLLARLWSAQRNCYGVALAPGPNSPAFVAAPPERLLRKRGARVESEALAGTLRAGTPDSDVAALLYDRKNLDEHQWVIDAVATHLRDAGVQLDAPHGTTVRTFRNVHHLHTAITGTMTARRHILQLVEDLHPTPAVGGTPRESALQWIADHESPRGYYASPVGWFNPDGDGEFSVAIRCALIDHEHAKLWAGAGIVSASDADIEYEEINAKLQTMLNALSVEPGL